MVTLGELSIDLSEFRENVGVGSTDRLILPGSPKIMLDLVSKSANLF